MNENLTRSLTLANKGNFPAYFDRSLKAIRYILILMVGELFKESVPKLVTASRTGTKINALSLTHFFERQRSVAITADYPACLPQSNLPQSNFANRRPPKKSQGNPLVGPDPPVGNHCPRLCNALSYTDLIPFTRQLWIPNHCIYIHFLLL